MFDINHLQKRTVETGREVFGDVNMDDPRERAFRFGEEAMELLHSAGLSFSDVLALAREEFIDRMKPAGELSQEIAGVQCTLFSLAAVHNVNTFEVTCKELARVLAKKDQCRAKHDAKPAHLTAQKVSAA